MNFTRHNWSAQKTREGETICVCTLCITEIRFVDAPTREQTNVLLGRCEWLNMASNLTATSPNPLKPKDIR